MIFHQTVRAPSSILDAGPVGGQDLTWDIWASNETSVHIGGFHYNNSTNNQPVAEPRWKKLSTLFRVTSSAFFLLLIQACGGGSAPAPTGLYQGEDDVGGGTANYLSDFRTVTDRALLRKHLAARTFLIAENQVDNLVNYSYNDWGQGHSCDHPGSYGGHAGIDYQTKSVAGTATADVSIYSISSGTFIAYRTYTWGITAIVRSRVRNAQSGQDQNVYFHYLHLRSENSTLRPGEAISVGANLGIQGSTDPKKPNDREHVHFEVALQELDYGHGAHPDMCNDSAGATLDPYPVLAGLFETTNQPPTLSLTSFTGSSVQVNQTYDLAFSAADADLNLSYVDVSWNDGTSVERKFIAGGTGSLTFSRSFTTAKTINWSANAYDSLGSASDMIQGTFSIIPAPTTGFSPTIGTITMACVLLNNSAADVRWTFDVQSSSQLFEGKVEGGSVKIYSSGCANLLSFGGTGGACDLAAPVNEWLGRTLSISVRETTTSGPWITKNITFPLVCP